MKIIKVLVEDKHMPAFEVNLRECGFPLFKSSLYKDNQFIYTIQTPDGKVNDVYRLAQYYRDKP